LERSIGQSADARMASWTGAATDLARSACRCCNFYENSADCLRSLVVKFSFYNVVERAFSQLGSMVGPVIAFEAQGLKRLRAFAGSRNFALT
jgi:hypothetical protein